MARSVSKSKNQIITNAVSGVGSTSTKSRTALSIATGKSPGSVSVLGFLGSAAEKLTIDSPEGIDALLSERALSSLRPELLSLFSFLPVKSETDEGTTAGQLFDLLVTARNLWTEDVQALQATLSEIAVFDESLENLQAEYDEEVASVQSQLEFLSKIMLTVNDMKRSLDLKHNSDSLQAAVKLLRSSRGVELPPVGQFSTPAGILGCQLGFEKSNVEAFSNTKFVGQILADLEASLTAFSPQLLGSYDSDRKDDTSPITILTTLSSDDDFTFTPSSVRSQTSNLLTHQLGTGALTNNLFDPTTDADFSSFLDSLPADDEDRIKILIVALSRELRMSAGVKLMTGTSLDDAYTVESGNLMTRIIGNPGEKITDGIPSEGSLASISRFLDADGNVILPLESRVIIDPDEEKTFVPGTIFLVDRILRGSDKFKTNALDDYASSVKSTVENGSSAIAKLMNFDDEHRTLYYISVFKDIMSFVADSIETLVKGASITEEQALGAALLVAAQTDPTLKRQLFNYLVAIRAGGYVSSSTSDPSGGGTSGGGSGGGRRGGPGGLPGLDDFGEAAAEAAAEADATSTRSRGSRSTNPSKAISAVSAIKSTKSSLGSAVASMVVRGTPSSIEQRVETLFAESLTTARALGHSRQTLRRSSSEASRTVTLADGSITDILDAGSSNDNFIFSKMADYADEQLESATRIVAAGNSHRYDDDQTKTSTGLTRMNRLSDDTLLLLLFETVVSFYSAFVDVKFSSASDGGQVKISVNKSKCSTVRSKMLSLAERISESSYLSTKTGTSRSSLSSSESYSAKLQALAEVFEAEEALIRDQVDMLRAISSTLSAQAATTSSFFGSSSSSTTGKKLTALLENADGDALVEGLSNMQVTLGWKASEDLLLSSDDSLLPDETVLTDSEINAVKALLLEAQFVSPAGDNLKILSVGMPAGLLTSLQHPTFTVGEDTSIASTSADLVTVKVYRLDPEFEDLVFKPMAFVFDMSRFAMNRAAIGEGVTLDSVLSSGYGLREVNPEAGLGSLDIASTMSQQSEYEGLTGQEIENLVRNHIVHELLRLYVKILSGMNFAEYTFLVDEGLLDVTYTDAALEFFETFLESTDVPCVSSTASNSNVALYVKGLQDGLSAKDAMAYSIQNSSSQIAAAAKASASTTASTSSSSGTCAMDALAGADSEEVDDVDSTEEDNDLDSELVARFKRLISTVFFNKSALSVRAMQTKMFERTFMLPVDPDEFVIDVDETSSTRAGKRLLRSAAFKNCTVETEDSNGNSVLKLAGRETEFSEFFSVISLGVDL